MLETSSESEVSNLKQYTYIVIFTTMTFLSTSMFHITIVTTNGFFNIGDTFVYLAALIGGPVVGGIAGGLGPALADIALGYGIFAPGTLIFKGAEGFVAGYLFYHTKSFSGKVKSTALFLGVFLLSGFIFFNLISWVTSFLGNPIIEYPTLTGIELSAIFFDLLVLITVILALLVIIWIIVTRMEDEMGNMTVSCLFAGSFIVLGYFLYELFIIDMVFAAALSEVPFNIAQVIVGTAIVVPVVYYLRDLGIVPEKTQIPMWKKHIK